VKDNVSSPMATANDPSIITIIVSYI